MRGADLLRYLGQGLKLQLSHFGSLGRARLGLGPEALGAVELPERPPDSRLAREAEELCRELSSRSLLNHCMRTYLWAALLGGRDHLSYDEELLFVACALHDLGLTDAWVDVPRRARCFAVEGAFEAADWAVDHGCDGERSRRIADAISLHVNPRVEVEQGVEAHLLTAGAAFDVIGARFREVGPALAGAGVERYPRFGFKREMDDRSRRAARRGPKTRVALAYRFGFGRLIAGAPFAE